MWVRLGPHGRGDCALAALPLVTGPLSCPRDALFASARPPVLSVVNCPRRVSPSSLTCCSVEAERWRGRRGPGCCDRTQFVRQFSSQSQHVLRLWRVPQPLDSSPRFRPRFHSGVASANVSLSSLQILTELEHSGIGRIKEQSARMLGHLVSNAPRLIRPYMEPILKVTQTRRWLCCCFVGLAQQGRWDRIAVHLCWTQWAVAFLTFFLIESP